MCKHRRGFFVIWNFEEVTCKNQIRAITWHVFPQISRIFQVICWNRVLLAHLPITGANRGDDFPGNSTSSGLFPIDWHAARKEKDSSDYLLGCFAPLSSLQSRRECPDHDYQPHPSIPAGQPHCSAIAG